MSRDDNLPSIVQGEDGRPYLRLPCAQCGKAFLATRADARYCGAVCRVDAMRERRRAARTDE